MNNKAIEWSLETIIGMVLAVAVLIVLLVFQQTIFTKIEGRTTTELCRASVKTMGELRFKDYEIFDKLKCETQYKHITKKDTELAKRDITGAVDECLYQFWNGELNLFKGDGRFCFVCSVIDFKDEGKKIKEIEGLYKHWFDVYKGSQTYAERFFQGKETEFLTELKKQGIELGKETIKQQDLGIYFIYDKGTAMEKGVEELAQETLGKLVTGKVAFVAAIPFLIKTGVVAGTTITIAGLGFYYYFVHGPDKWRATFLIGPYDERTLRELSKEGKGCDFTVPVESKEER